MKAGVRTRRESKTFITTHYDSLTNTKEGWTQTIRSGSTRNTRQNKVVMIRLLLALHRVHDDAGPRFLNLCEVANLLTLETVF